MKLCILLLAVVSLKCQAVPGPAMNDFTRSLRAFTAFMYAEVAENYEVHENIFFSPSSIAHTMGMVMAGAGGNTENEIKRALMIDMRKAYTQSNINNLYRKVYNKLFNITKSKRKSEAHMASRLFLQNGYPIKENYTRTLQDYYDSDVFELDFSDNVNAANTINRWVEEKTKDLIKDLLQEDSIEPLTRMVLVNALYFSARWKNKMYKIGYKDMEFHTPNGIVRMPFMGQNTSIKRSAGEDYEQVVIPYKNNDAYLLIIMPDNEDAMARMSQTNYLVQHLRNLPDHDRLNQGLSAIHFSMPMFDMEQEMDAKEVLMHMGVRDLFSEETANLTGITEERVYVSAFTHKAKVTVDEQGTKAAAASSVTITGRSAGPPTVTINKPFFFGIYRQGHLLFFGRYSGPPKAAQVM